MLTPISNPKQALRATIAKQRQALCTSDWRKQSDSIHAHIYQCKLYQQANTVFTFISINNEVDTRALMQRAWADGKHVAVPITAAGGKMYFYSITPSTALTKTKYGTLEPTANPQAIAAPQASDLFLVPGLVFDTAGARYGYGGGFYDRFLEKYPYTTPIAIAFSFQISKESLQTQPHDIAMQWIVTEKGWIKTTQTNKK